MPLHGSKARRKAQVKLEQEFWNRVNKFRWLFQITPHIKWVGVCNSLPMRNLKQGSDIDLFIVADKGKLFTARLWVTLLTSIFGVRRHGNKTHKRFCLSFFVEEGHEALETIAIKEDIYLAKWIKTLEPISGDWSAYEKFIQSNKEWTHTLVKKLKYNRAHFKKRNTFQAIARLLLSMPTLLLEKKLREWQLNRAREKAKSLKSKRGTIITEHQLKFHDNDRREELRDKWKKA